jgi:hypothetical protein
MNISDDAACDLKSCFIVLGLVHRAGAAALFEMSFFSKTFDFWFCGEIHVIFTYNGSYVEREWVVIKQDFF